MKNLFETSNYLKIIIFLVVLVIIFLIIPNIYSGGLLGFMIIIGVLLSQKIVINSHGIFQNKFFVKKRFFAYNQLSKVICNGVENYDPSGNDQNRVMFISKDDKKIIISGAFENTNEDKKMIVSVLKYIENQGVNVFLYVPDGYEDKRLFKAGFSTINHLNGYEGLW